LRLFKALRRRFSLEYHGSMAKKLSKLEVIGEHGEDRDEISSCSTACRSRGAASHSSRPVLRTAIDAADG
jgi:hypothetical protein